MPKRNKHFLHKIYRRFVRCRVVRDAYACLIDFDCIKLGLYNNLTSVGNKMTFISFAIKDTCRAND